MNLDEALKGLLKTREALQSKQGVTNPVFISENMQRLAQYVGAVEVYLADLESELENLEMTKFLAHLKEGKSVNMSETLTKQEVGSHKGEIAKLSRLVKSSWSIIGTAQSRWNHLDKDMQLGKHQV